MSEHVCLRDRGVRPRSLRSCGKPGREILEISQGSVELVAPTEISDQPRHHVGGLGLRREVTARFGALTPARVTERFVAEADSHAAAPRSRAA
jgi:hypothetical protein